MKPGRPAIQLVFGPTVSSNGPYGDMTPMFFRFRKLGLHKETIIVLYLEKLNNVTTQFLQHFSLYSQISAEIDPVCLIVVI